MAGSGMTLPAFFEARKTGNKACRKLWDKYLSDLALTIENARMVINGRFILGGLLSEYITDEDIVTLKEKIRSISCFPSVEPLIEHSHYGSKATVIGSAITQIADYLERVGLDMG